MQDRDDEQPQDDFEVEITDLDERSPGRDQPGPYGTKAAFSRESLRRALEPQFWLRHRKLQLLVTTSIVVLALVVIFGSTVSVRNLVSGTSAGLALTATPASAPLNDLFYFQLNPPWGHLFIDGHAIARVPTASTDPPLSLPPGQHKVVWQAAPFRPVSCILAVPVASNPSTCNHSQFTPENTNQLISLVELRVTTDMLPGAQRAALLSATQTALDTEQHSQTVLPGEAYAVPSEIADTSHHACRLVEQVVLCFTTAQQPLRATLHFQLDTDTSYNGPCADKETCSYNGFDCRVFCSLTDGQWPDAPSIVPDDSAWNAVVAVQSFWQYTTLSGQVVAQNEGDNFVGGIENDHLVPLDITWDGAAWHISVLPANAQGFFFVPVCDSALSDAQDLLNNVAASDAQLAISFQFAYEKDLSAGCLIEASQGQDPFVTPTPTSSPPIMAYLLHRFGVLVAANAQAHRLWPFLPIADANEQQVIQQLVSSLG
ncbi:MAG TPA: hypothetical protein VJ761_02580 [Ktedonobacteraceae bacterium]|nr:hypothetical protein [Ktedonobacteraceae bacterium]